MFNFENDNFLFLFEFLLEGQSPVSPFPIWFHFNAYNAIYLFSLKFLFLNSCINHAQNLFCLFVYFWATLSGAQRLFLACSGSIWDAGIKPRLAACKANALLTVLSLWPPLRSFIYSFWQGWVLFCSSLCSRVSSGSMLGTYTVLEVKLRLIACCHFLS